MEKAEAQYHFHEADRLYKEEHYLDALQHLAELNNGFPNTFNILFPMLLCREKLGRIDEAHEQCSSMLRDFPADKHQKRLRTALLQISRVRANASPAGGGLIQPTSVNIPIDKSDVFVIGNWEVPWRTIAAYAGIIMLVLVLLASLPLAVNRIEEDEDGRFTGLLIFLTSFVQFVLSCVVAYIVVWLMNSLNHDSILRDTIDVAVIMAIFSVLCLVPFLGWIFGLYLIKRHFEMSFADIFLFVVLQAMFHMAFLYLVIPLVFGASATTILQFVQ